VHDALLARFGILIRHGFLDPETCARVRENVQRASSFAARVEGSGKVALDTERRRSRIAQVDDETADLVAEPLRALTPTLEEHFETTFSGFQDPEFLVYGEGDFFRPHTDSSPLEEAADFRRERRVSTVVILNPTSEEPQPGTYGGGALTFYGLMGGDERAAGVGMAFEAREGSLVAFRSEVVHGVAPVTHGERYSVTTWFV